MHIPDNVLSQPVILTTGAIALGGFAFGLRTLQNRLRERTMVLMGVMSAFIFAAQMVNFPLFVVPASGHLIGGVLAAVLLGPWAGALVMGTVLIVQCLLFADGGLLALGANFVNLGLIASVGGYAIYDPIRRAIGGQSGVLIGAMIAAWFSVLLASLAFTVELGVSGFGPDFPTILGWMSMVHAIIGLGEALITGFVLRTVLLVRPDLIFDEKGATTRSGRWGRVAVGGLAASLAVAAFLGPLASPQDDGLEYVGDRFGFIDEEAGSILGGPMPDYSIEGLPDIAPVTAAVGLIGTLTVFVAGLVLARAFTRPETEGTPEDHTPPAAGGPAPHAA